MMEEPNGPENPRTANEHAHAFGEKVQSVRGVKYARVKRATFTGVSWASISIDSDMDKEKVAELATTHNATDIDTNAVLERVTFTFGPDESE